jgi:hypothetical protein
MLDIADAAAFMFFFLLADSRHRPPSFPHFLFSSLRRAITDCARGMLPLAVARGSFRLARRISREERRQRRPALL